MDATAMTDPEDHDPEASTNQEAAREDDEHLDDIPDGSGCAEIWERLSERRAADDD